MSAIGSQEVEGVAGIPASVFVNGEDSGVRVRPLSEAIGAEIEGVDLSHPISDGEYGAIEQALAQHGVLVFRKQDLPPAMHVDFASRFGRLVGHIVKRFSVADYPEVTYISNVVDDKGEKIGADRAGMLWHADAAYLPKPMLG